MGADKFVEVLHARWQARHKASSGPAQAAVREIKAGLEAAGITTWFDLDRLEAGDDYDRKIQRNIARCSYFIPVSSATTQRRTEAYFRREWSYAIDRSRSRSRSDASAMRATAMIKASD